MHYLLGFVIDGNLEPRVKVGLELTQADDVLDSYVQAVEDVGVGHPVQVGAVLRSVFWSLCARQLTPLEFDHGYSGLVAFELIAVCPLGAIAPDLDVHPVGRSHRCLHPDPVLGAGRGHSASQPLACVRYSQECPRSRHAELIRVMRRDATAVVSDRDGVVLVQHDVDLVGNPELDLVQRVHQGLFKGVLRRVQGAQVHTRALEDVLQALVDLDLGVVVGLDEVLRIAFGHICLLFCVGASAPSLSIF